ncbi:hypothetical protein G1C96_0070 [Bifidobacterium sp. DSM 109958]|uniref:Uncharacterized protein n=1 Tax=Bifidobacterium moraviense TaxID=2675323 RepID=A0A7Y0F0C5_9BIFI|nr:hypothetical protein [Bifidobacterium sp. DSM 109958]NMM99493.1 hypothetical protein [Bifidobacterium sp. DSM 109958]
MGIRRYVADDFADMTTERSGAWLGWTAVGSRAATESMARSRRTADRAERIAVMVAAFVFAMFLFAGIMSLIFAPSPTRWRNWQGLLCLLCSAIALAMLIRLRAQYREERMHIRSVARDPAVIGVEASALPPTLRMAARPDYIDSDGVLVSRTVSRILWDGMHGCRRCSIPAYVPQEVWERLAGPGMPGVAADPLRRFMVWVDLQAYGNRLTIAGMRVIPGNATADALRPQGTQTLFQFAPGDDLLIEG